MTVKITLNEKDVFEKLIIDYLKDKKNRSGELKRLAYDQIRGLSVSNGNKRQALPPVSSVQQDTLDQEETEIKSKLDKLLNF
ncbi:MAG: hypothetical protein M1610_00945 [Nitrospirae bacterium]|nr:hypothetical protein [Nitrospirota bacterium]MDA8338360.1 hypothetical protein [Nitrospiraceae bacterium]